MDKLEVAFCHDNSVSTGYIALFFLITGTFKIQRGTMNKHAFVVYSLWISYVTTVQWCLFITEKQMLQFRG